MRASLIFSVIDALGKDSSFGGNYKCLSIVVNFSVLKNAWNKRIFVIRLRVCLKNSNQNQTKMVLGHLWVIMDGMDPQESTGKNLAAKMCKNSKSWLKLVVFINIVVIFVDSKNDFLLFWPN